MNNPNDTAFPIPNPGPFDSLGLTKREYLAALALQGILVSTGRPRQQTNDYECEAANAVAAADALIEQLKRKPL